MSCEVKKQVENLIVDTTAFIQNASLHYVADNIVTCKEVIEEITNKRQLRRLAVLPYNLIVKDIFPENIKFVTEFAKKTGDYPSLSAVDIKVIALTYQMEKEKVGTQHLRAEPVIQSSIITTNNVSKGINPDITGFFLPGVEKQLQLNKEVALGNSDSDSDHDNDDTGWITPSNVALAKKQVNSELIEEKHVTVACMTTDFAMQNVLKQINLNVSALDGRIITRLRTYILRCYTCFKTTSIMTKKFCPKCGNDTLKKVAVSVNEHGETQIHINPKKPLSGKGKKFSLPTFRGGKHPNNPIIVEDQPMADNKPSRLARTKNNPLDDDYIAGFSPFVMRDVNSKSAQLCIRPGSDFKQWTRKNSNHSRRKM